MKAIQRGATQIRDKEKVSLCVGLDYGTDTVKCILSAAVGSRRKRSHHVIKIDNRALFPSVLWEGDGEVGIGKSFKRLRLARRSAKVHLRCLAGMEPCPRCYQDTQLDPEIISWAIVAYCAKQVRDQVEHLYPARVCAVDWARVEWQMGVPLDSTHRKSLLDLFRDVLWRAIHGGDAVTRKMKLDHLLAAYETVRSLHCPPPEDSNCCVIPEAVVAANAFLQLHRRTLELGLYGVCDIGAGTLDIAFFRYHPDGDRPIVCYDTSCTRVGGDNFAQLLAHEKMRCDRNLDPQEAFGLACKELARGAVKKHSHLFDVNAAFAKDVYAAIKRGFRVALKKSYEKEKVWDRWRNLKLVIIGGPRDIPGIAETLLQKIPTGHPPTDFAPELLRVKMAELDGMTELHGIAYGLSIPRGEYDDYWHPEEVEPADIARLDASEAPSINDPSDNIN